MSMGAGRPKKIRLARIETCIETIKEALTVKYPHDLSIAIKKTPTKKTLQNLAAPSRGELTKHGDRKCPLLDLDEVLKKFVG